MDDGVIELLSLWGLLLPVAGHDRHSDQSAEAQEYERQPCNGGRLDHGRGSLCRG